jgi:hypothetical protein
MSKMKIFFIWIVFLLDVSAQEITYFKSKYNRYNNVWKNFDEKELEFKYWKDQDFVMM